MKTGGIEHSGNLKWLNSMRALGVLLVLVYHFFPSFLPGGFIGVDLFFVVSGYLITSLLIRESESAGRIRLGAFYRRRWRRLFPAICGMLLLCLPLSLLISPDFRVDVARQCAAALSWTTNYYEILTGQSYEAQLLPHLFIHTWTLSVEMQYYLIWGAVMLCIAVFAKGRRGQRVTLLIAAVVLFILSALWMNRLAAEASDPSVAYMSTQSHFFPLMAGSAFAAVGGFAPLSGLKKLTALPFYRPLSLGMIAAGIAFIVWLSFDFSFGDPRVYAWGIAAVSLVSGGIILLAGGWQGLSSREEWKLTNYIGLRSYSIYLFHWPFLILSQHLVPLIGVPQQLAQTVGALCAIPITFVVAELSYRYVEQRFRLRSAVRVVREEADVLSPRKARRRVSMAICICIVAVLGFFSVRAAISAPFISTIEGDLKYGAMTLDVKELNEAFEEGTLPGEGTGTLKSEGTGESDE
jgi:peptidoglycan/LPS O-acetylase OafA/YrhL